MSRIIHHECIINQYMDRLKDGQRNHPPLPTEEQRLQGKPFDYHAIPPTRGSVPKLFLVVTVWHLSARLQQTK
jgi:hypothetical protein